MKKPKRNREKYLKVYVTDEEKTKILKRMQQAKEKRNSNFVRDAALEKEIKVIDHSVSDAQLKDIGNYIFALNKIGNNINQIAKKANETDEVEKKDMDELVEQFEKIKDEVSSSIDKFLFKQK